MEEYIWKNSKLFFLKHSLWRGIFDIWGVTNIPSWSDFDYLAPMYIWGVHCAFLMSSNVLSTTHLVTQLTPADIFQITMPGTPTSPPPWHSPRSKMKVRSSTTTSNDSKSDTDDEQTPTTPPPWRSPRPKKLAHTSENSESDADEQTPTSPHPPWRAPRGKKKAHSTSTTSDNS